MGCYFRGFSAHVTESLQQLCVSDSMTTHISALIQSQLVTDTLTTDYTVGDAQRLIAIADASIRRRLESHPSGLNHIPTYLTVKGMRPAQALAVLTRNETEPVKAEVYAIAQQVIERLNRIASAERIAQAAEYLAIALRVVEYDVGMPTQSLEDHPFTNQLSAMIQALPFDEYGIAGDDERGHAVLARIKKRKGVRPKGLDDRMAQIGALSRMIESMDAVLLARIYHCAKNKKMLGWDRGVLTAMHPHLRSNPRVDLDDRGRVVGLTFSNPKPLQPIIEILCRFSHLRSVMFASVESLEDMIDLHRIPNLQELTLRMSPTVSPDPVHSQAFLESLGQARNLTKIDFMGPMVGTIPSSWKHLQQLRRCELDGIGLTGPFPAVFLQLPHLEVLSLPRNKLRGTLPALRRMRALQSLSLRGNQITAIPDDPRQYPPSLVHIDVSDNAFLPSLRLEQWLKKKKRDHPPRTTFSSHEIHC